MQLNGVPVIITGGGSGLGAATARAMAAKGAKVACLDVRKENADAIAAEVKGISLGADVTDEEQVKAALAKAEASHGIARILVNCAGIGTASRTIGRNGPFPYELFKRTININLIGTFNMIRLAADAMCKAGPNAAGERGVIINTASVAAYDGQIGQAAYSASKGGVVGMTLPIARDLSRNGIRVVTIAPGLFLTPMLLGLPKDAQDSLGKQVPFPSRLGKPEEYAQLAQQIVENEMLNGETIRLDGAIRMAPK